MYWLVSAALGTLCGALLASGLLMNTGAEGLGVLLDIITLPAAGSLSSAPIGVYSGITGGIIGGLVAFGLNIVPIPGYFFIHIPFGVLLTKLLVTASLAGLFSLFVPH